ncbi:CCD81 protein, partial [Upupa epops]|nr:CCD81 protein [Upupa epops]
PGNKVLETVKYCKVATAASVSRRKVECCIEGTASLISHCLLKGHNVALVLNNVGVLVIEGTKVQLKFYKEFFKAVSGKDNVKKVSTKFPRLLDMVSPVVPVASLTWSGRAIIFPR